MSNWELLKLIFVIYIFVFFICLLLTLSASVVLFVIINPVIWFLTGKTMSFLNCFLISCVVLFVNNCLRKRRKKWRA
jgi:hypothetical protein